MEVFWSVHSKERFFERALLYGLNEEEVENCIKKQEVKLVQENGKIKTIFSVIGKYFTVIKVENKKKLCVVSIWESNNKEIEVWKNQKWAVFFAMEK